MNTPNLAHTLVAGALRFALLFALFGAGWSIYRALPDTGPVLPGDVAGQPRETVVRVVLRRQQQQQPPPEERSAPAGGASVQLYSVDVAALQREFRSERRPGMRFEEFLKRRMGARQPITGQFDERGEATLTAPPGRWWIHALLRGPEEVTWVLPVNVSGRERIVELTPENAYTRARSF